MRRGKVDYAVRVRVPRRYVVQANTSRDVYIYQGDMYIDDYAGEIIRV